MNEECLKYIRDLQRQATLAAARIGPSHDGFLEYTRVAMLFGVCVWLPEMQEDAS